MAIDINPSIVTIEGVDYYAHPSTVQDFRIETEDHGIFTFWVYVDLSTGGSQGFGGYALDESNRKYNEPPKEDRPWTSVKDRTTGKFGAECVLCLVKLLGTPGSVRGKTVLALKEDSGWGGQIVGLATLKGDYFLPKVLAKTLYPERN